MRKTGNSLRTHIKINQQVLAVLNKTTMIVYKIVQFFKGVGIGILLYKVGEWILN